MWTTLSVIALIAVTTDCSNDIIITVPKCPCHRQELLEHEERLACEGKLYTCIETKNGTLIECCILPYKFQESDTGCPYVETITYSEGPIIGVKHTDCTVPGCPPQGHDEYYINEMYKYPACLIPLQQRRAIKSMADFERLCPGMPKSDDKTITSSPMPVQLEENSSTIFILITIGPFLLISAIIIAVILNRKTSVCRKNIEGGIYSNHQEFVNYATGLAWSHYTGYLSTLLPVFQDVITGSTTYKTYPDRTITNWILLCPKSGKSSNITDDPRISLEESVSVPGIKPLIDVFRISNDKDSKRCNDGLVIFFSDNNQDGTSGISNAILNHIEMEQQKILNKDEKILPEVCLLHTGLQNRKTKQKFLDFEKAISMKCHPRILHLRKDDQRIILKIIDQSKWIVLYDIDEDIHSDFQLIIGRMEKQIRDGECNLVVVFSGSDQENATRFIPWTIAIDIDKELHASDKVIRIISGESVQLTSDIVLGDLSCCLTWAFHVNYLKHVIPDMFSRMKETIEQESQKSSLEKLGRKKCLSRCFWQIIPSSCQFKTLDDFDRDLSTPIHVIPLKTQLFGSKRVFSCSLYHFKKTDVDFYFLGEVFAPCKVLSAMKESNIVRLSDRNMEKQRNRLKTQMNSLLHTLEKVESSEFNIKVISFNDRGKRRLTEIMYEEINSELKVVEVHESRKMLNTPSENIPLLETDSKRILKTTGD